VKQTPLSLPWRLAVAVIITACVFARDATAQAPPDQPPPPLVIGRDPHEAAEVIGKNFQLRVWLTNVGGPGLQRIYSLRVGADGNAAIPGVAPLHAEGVPVATLEQQALVLYKPIWPQATVWITVTDRTPLPPPPAPPSPPPPAPVPTPAAVPAAAALPAPPAPPATQPTTKAVVATQATTAPSAVK